MNADVLTVRVANGIVCRMCDLTTRSVLTFEEFLLDQDRNKPRIERIKRIQSVKFVQFVAYSRN